MKVVILCGGKGTRLREETENKPKPMVEIGGKPILWHIMKTYAHFGFKEFILALGYKGQMIKEYFLNYRTNSSDFTLALNNGCEISYHSKYDIEDWKITFADTGEDTMTGARVARVAKYIDDDAFMLTYGDGLADINIKKLVAFHKGHGRIATVTGVHIPSRFGKLIMNEGDDCVREFTEKPTESGISDYINGGYFVLNRDFFNYVDADDSCILEREPLENSARDGQLAAYRHDGYWQCMDTYRDYLSLQDLWKKGNPPWKVWQK